MESPSYKKRENLESAQNRKTDKTLDQNFCESEEDLKKILIDLEQSKYFSDIEAIDDVSNLDLQYNNNTKFGKQETNKVNNIDLSNNQKLEKVLEFKDSLTEVNRLKGYFCSKSVFSLSKKVLNGR